MFGKHSCFIEKNRRQNVLKLVEHNPHSKVKGGFRTVLGYVDITPTAEAELRAQFQHQYRIARKVEEVAR